MENIRIVLSHPQHPGNIGAVARAMKTMGLTDLRLVNPCEDPTGESRARARGGLDILEAAKIHSSLEEAVAGCHTVIGTSARMRGLQYVVQDPHQLAQDLAKNASMLPAALLFGREAHGLFNEELALCHRQIYIPANPEYSSLNLGSAVQIIAYELRMAFLRHEPLPVDQGDLRDLPASSEHMDELFSHMHKLATRVEFLKPTASEKLFSRLRRLYLRAQPTLREVNILRGIMRATEEKLDER
ncbi:RNA methyltransferase [Permianibacter aggregans]|uniref:tRNA (cytidine/uridine-2'-O-)-methyltransferase TrmJ n=1 Tax=Permianibacter aggregans TaxID=1510150 RepID=A0A4R6UFR8_9GAMM|nr:RNA methyltransferase [Permianibacter aggregans]TDQ45102.1 tRNA/rRNA methyltransferase/tRNA (cytidine32/uridine32-2'-O)-methyltransferase [Permianibacter aggregans]